MVNVKDIKQYEKLNDLILEQSEIIIDMFDVLNKEKLKEYPNPNSNRNIFQLMDKVHYDNPFDYKDVYIKSVSDDGIIIEAIDLGYDWHTVEAFIDIKYFDCLELFDNLEELRVLIDKEVSLKFKDIDEEYNKLIKKEQQYKLEQGERDRVFIEEMKKRFPKES